MSAKYTFRALSYKADNSIQKLILITLGDICGAHGECWPSYQYIADACCLGKSTVKKHLRELAGKGILTLENRAGPKGNTSNLYRLNLPKTEWEGGSLNNPHGSPRSPKPNQESNKDKDLVGKQVSPHTELKKEMFESLWEFWIHQKKILEVNHKGHSKENAKTHWLKLFNNDYFKTHTERQFRDEVNSIFENAQEVHILDKDDFTSARKQHLVFFLKKLSWRN